MQGFLPRQVNQLEWGCKSGPFQTKTTCSRESGPATFDEVTSRRQDRLYRRHRSRCGKKADSTTNGDAIACAAVPGMQDLIKLAVFYGAQKWVTLCSGDRP